MITRKDGKVAYMNDVLYVPSMKNNLLNLVQLLEKGYTMNMQQKLIEIYDSQQRLVIRAPLSKNKTFKVNLDTTEIQCLAVANVEDESWLWHYRYGHLNFKSLNQLSSKKMVERLPQIELPAKIREGCVIGKQPRKAFTDSAPKRAKQVLKVRHSDLCGPLDTPSLGGNKYFPTFVDEFSRKIWVYLIKERCFLFLKSFVPVLKDRLTAG